MEQGGLLARQRSSQYERRVEVTLTTTARKLKTKAATPKEKP